MVTAVVFFSSELPPSKQSDGVQSNADGLQTYSFWGGPAEALIVETLYLICTEW